MIHSIIPCRKVAPVRDQKFGFILNIFRIHAVYKCFYILALHASEALPLKVFEIALRNKKAYFVLSNSSWICFSFSNLISIVLNQYACIITFWSTTQDVRAKMWWWLQTTFQISLNISFRTIVGAQLSAQYVQTYVRRNYHSQNWILLAIVLIAFR